MAERNSVISVTVRASDIHIYKRTYNWSAHDQNLPHPFWTLISTSAVLVISRIFKAISFKRVSFVISARPPLFAKIVCNSNVAILTLIAHFLNYLKSKMRYCINLKNSSSIYKLHIQHVCIYNVFLYIINIYICLLF